MSGRSDVIGSHAEVSDVILGARVVARVFEGRPGAFFYVNQLNDSMPVGPFEDREDAEIAADISIDQDLRMDRWEMMLDS